MQPPVLWFVMRAMFAIYDANFASCLGGPLVEPLMLDSFVASDSTCFVVCLLCVVALVFV